MANLELPIAMLCLSRLSSNPTIRPQAAQWMPPRDAVLVDPKVRDVLDAIVYFLSVSKGHAFALSLEIGESVRIAIAGNDDDHFQPAFGRTPSQAVEFIWTKLGSIATLDGVSLKQNVGLLVECLLERQETRTETRFDKHKEPCTLFFKLAGDPEWRSERTPEQIKFLETAESIFRESSKFFGLSQEGRKKWYTQFLLLLNEAAAKPGAWYHKLEVKVKDELRLCEPFDLASYINKLLAPAVHISCLIKTARKPKFKDIFNLPLHVLEVHTYLHYTPSNPPNPPSKEDIRSFLARCYGRCPPDYDDDYDEDEDEAIASDVLDMKLVEVLSAFESCSTLNIKPPHCETTLVHHHLSHEEESPIPYIAVSKPSCLNCGLYLAACGNYWMQKRCYEKGRFQTHGCCGEVTPLLALPSGSATAELDAFVKDDILEKVVNFAAAALRHSLQAERIRRMPQRRNPFHGLFMSLHTEDTGPQDIENAPSQPEQ